jgi:hypothetical protein
MRPKDSRWCGCRPQREGLGSGLGSRGLGSLAVLWVTGCTRKRTKKSCKPRSVESTTVFSHTDRFSLTLQPCVGVGFCLEVQHDVLAVLH